MAIFNKVMFDGYLTADPKDQVFEGGLKTSFSIGLNPGKDQPVMWINCRVTSFIKEGNTHQTPAERAFADLKKGDHVIFEGHIVSWNKTKDDGSFETLWFVEVDRFAKGEKKPATNNNYPD